MVGYPELVRRVDLARREGDRVRSPEQSALRRDIGSLLERRMGVGTRAVSEWHYNPRATRADNIDGWDVRRQVDNRFAQLRSLKVAVV